MCGADTSGDFRYFLGGKYLKDLDQLECMQKMLDLAWRNNGKLNYLEGRSQSCTPVEMDAWLQRMCTNEMQTFCSALFAKILKAKKFMKFLQHLSHFYANNGKPEEIHGCTKEEAAALNAIRAKVTQQMHMKDFMDVFAKVEEAKMRYAIMQACRMNEEKVAWIGGFDVVYT